MGTYITRADVEAVWGASNVAEWANLESADPPVNADARIAAAILWAEGWLHVRMADGPYTLPLSGTDADMAVIRDVVVRYAGRWLYSARRHERPDEPDLVDGGFAFAESIVDKLLAGALRLKSVAKVGSGRQPTAPVVR